VVNEHLTHETRG
jgi:hypothetical protein